MIQTHKMIKTKEKNACRILLALMVFIILVVCTNAMPVPHGVDGYIHELDDVTPAGRINFSIYNVDTNEYIQSLSRGNGYYSVALNGENGDRIVIRTWTPYHQTEKNLTLQGVMHHVDLIINTSAPEMPLEVKSTPITAAEVSVQYRYQIIASDPNEDVIYYSLLISPEKMTITSNGLIEWVPKNKETGLNHVVVDISDGRSHTLHAFDINVSEKKSTKLLNNLESTDALQRGQNKIQTLLGTQNEGVIKELSARPAQTKPFDKTVYKYLEITKPQRIMVKVEFSWLNQNNASKEDITLSQYKENSWQIIPVSIASEDKTFVYYQANVPSSGYFAVSLKSSIEPDRTVITGPKEPHIIAGTIFQNKNSRQVAAGTPIKITNNRTGEVTEEKTGLPGNSGAFYALIHGNNGDKIELEVKKGFNREKKTILLDGDMKNINLLSTNNGLFSITGLASAPMANITLSHITILIIIFLLVGSVFTITKRKKSKPKATSEIYKILR
jgi:hypothetical protein